MGKFNLLQSTLFSFSSDGVGLSQLNFKGLGDFPPMNFADNGVLQLIILFSLLGVSSPLSKDFLEVFAFKLGLSVFMTFDTCGVLAFVLVLFGVRFSLAFGLFFMLSSAFNSIPFLRLGV